jgi:hypothetical protein
MAEQHPARKWTQPDGWILVATGQSTHFFTWWSLHLLMRLFVPVSWFSPREAKTAAHAPAE